MTTKNIIMLILAGAVLAGIIAILANPLKPPTAEKVVEEIKKEVVREYKPDYQEEIENNIKKMFNEGLRFTTIYYQQLDPMENGLYHCRNKFTGKATKKEHTYFVRVGYDKELGTSTVFFISIDGETLQWDEEAENEFIDTH